MKEIIMLKGLPASGKSTYAKNLIDKHPGVFKRVNKDELRAMLDNSKWSKDNEKFVLRLRDLIIVEALRDGKQVIVDDTNLHPKHEVNLARIAKDEGAHLVIKDDFMSVSLKTCIERDLSRSNSVGEYVIKGMYNQFIKKKGEPVKYNHDLDDCVIVDIDGTLAKMTERGPYDWDKVSTDELNRPVAMLVRQLKKFLGYHLIIVTGRDGSCEMATRQWLKDYNIDYDEFYIRPAGNNEKDAKIKRQIYEDHIKGKHNVSFILDDRNQVVEMWRSLGLPCFQVDEGDF